MLQTIKLHAKNVLARAGFEVHRVQAIPSQVPWIRHAAIYPRATYAPWLADQEFRRVHEAISPHTLVDQYRCYELWSLVAESAKLADGDVIEVGVWRGGTGCLIASRCRQARIHAAVHLCDNFQGMVKTGEFDTSFSGGELADASAASVRQLAARLGLANIHVRPGVFPEESGSALENVRFRFGHIDVAVYRSGRDIFRWLWPRMVPGGIVVFDDYGFRDSEGITRLVEEERSGHDRLVLHNLNGHAIFIKLT